MWDLDSRRQRMAESVVVRIRPSMMPAWHKTTSLSLFVSALCLCICLYLCQSVWPLFTCLSHLSDWLSVSCVPEPRLSP